MGTTLVNPSGGGVDAIDQAFSKMFSMFGNSSGGSTGGGGTGAFGLQPQPVSGGNNDLTQYQWSLTNLAGTTGAGLVGAGTGLVGGSIPIIQSGTDIQTAGLGPVATGTGTLGTSLSTLQPSIDFYNKLLQGDPTATAQALAPTASNIAAITAGATNQTSQGTPQGGFRASTLANLPYAQAAQVGNAALQLQPAAAAALQQAAQTQAGIGTQQVGAGTAEAGIGQGISQTGLGVGQLGTVLTGQGLQTLQNTIADVLQKMGINIQGGTAATFSQIVGSL